MGQTEIIPVGFGWRLAGAGIVPFVVESAYLVFARWPLYRFTALSDYAGLAVSVLVGAALVATLPIRPLHRFLSLVVYVPLLSALLFCYALFFIALVFHDAL